jgi:multiple sugar transport system permease protein
MAPFLVLFFLFMILPVLSSIVLSFTDFNMVQMPKFIGVSNYVRIFFSDKVFLISLKNTLLFALIAGPVGYVLSFVVAWLINGLGRALRSAVTLIVYAPTLAGNIYFIWQYVFASDSRGFLNNALIRTGLISDPILWLTDPNRNFGVVLVVVIWMSLGTGFLSFVAGLQALDRTYYEAAAIDGLKNSWQELYYVTFPQMGPQLMFGAVMSISAAFAIGYQNMALTGFPSTDYSTHTILLHLLDFGTIRFEMGYACALAVILFAIMLASWALINKLLKKFNG